MKTNSLLFTALLTFILINSLTAQQQFYLEQNSGVTSNLTSVCISGEYNYLRVWVCGSGGVVLKSTNMGTNWINVSSNGIPATLNLVNINCKGFDTALTAGTIGTTTYVYRTSNGGSNWVQVFSQPNGFINALWMRNAVQGFMVGNPVGGRWSLWKTTNGGINWDSTGMYLPQNGTEIGWSNSLAIKFNYAWFGTNNSRLYKSTNDGINWVPILTTQLNSSAVWIYHDTSASLVFVLNGGSNSYYTTNGGSNWYLQNCPDTNKFVGFSAAYVGVDWWPMGLYAARNNSKIYAGGVGSFFAEYTAPAGIYNHLAYDIPIFYSPYNWAVRSNGGITRITLFRGGAVKKISSEIPITYSLQQNFPNPFNPSTKIMFSVPNPSKGKFEIVRLTVYDLLGRQIEVLVNEQLTSGTYEVSFDASKYSSGMYFYRLAVGDYIETKRMILVK